MSRHFIVFFLLYSFFGRGFRGGLKGKENSSKDEIWFETLEYVQISGGVRQLGKEELVSYVWIRDERQLQLCTLFEKGPWLQSPPASL